jgi:hypothetical protein
MSGFVVGGDSAWKVRSKGDIGVAFHWVNKEPSVVIYPLHRGMRLTGGVPFVMPLSSAHELVAEGGEEVNAQALIEKAAKAAELLGAPGDRFLTHKIADALLESLDDLCDMPPEPPANPKRPKGEDSVILKADGQTVFETTL